MLFLAIILSSPFLQTTKTVNTCLWNYHKSHADDGPISFQAASIILPEDALVITCEGKGGHLYIIIYIQWLMEVQIMLLITNRSINHQLNQVIRNHSNCQ